VVCNATGDSSKVLPEVIRSTIYCSTFVTCAKASFVGVGSSGGFQLWCGDGNDMKYFVSLSALMTDIVDSADLEQHYVQCVSSCGFKHIVLGGSNGYVYVLEVSNASGEGVTVIHRLNTGPDVSNTNYPHRSIVAINGVGSSKAVCANECGDIFAYDSELAYKLTCVIPASAVMNNEAGLITSLLTRDDTIIAGYNTGHIRIFRMSVQELAIDISAHYRCITGLALHPTAPLFCSCSEDQYMYVWGFPDFTTKHSSDADLIHSEHFENRKCTGVTFFEHGSVIANNIAVSHYDEAEVAVLSKAT
jgi:hypothetical protein